MFFIHSHHSNMTDTRPHPCHSVSHLSHSLRTMSSHYSEAHEHTHTHTKQDLCHQLKQAVTEWAEWLTASFFSENQNSGSNDHTSPLLTVLGDISVPHCSVHLLRSCKTVYLQGNSVKKFLKTFWKCQFLLHVISRYCQEVLLFATLPTITHLSRISILHIWAHALLFHHRAKRSGEEQFQLYFHVSLVRHCMITNRSWNSQHSWLTVLNCAGRMHVVTSPLRIGRLSVAWLTVSL